MAREQSRISGAESSVAKPRGTGIGYHPPMLRSRNFGNYVLLVMLLALLAMFLLYPIMLTLRGAFYQDVSSRSGFTLRHLGLVFEDPATFHGIINSLKIATGTTLRPCSSACRWRCSPPGSPFR